MAKGRIVAALRWSGTAKNDAESLGAGHFILQHRLVADKLRAETRMTKTGLALAATPTRRGKPAASDDPARNAKPQQQAYEILGGRQVEKQIDRDDGGNRGQGRLYRRVGAAFDTSKPTSAGNEKSTVDRCCRADRGRSAKRG